MFNPIFRRVTRVYRTQFSPIDSIRVNTLFRNYQLKKHYRWPSKYSWSIGLNSIIFGSYLCYDLISNELSSSLTPADLREENYQEGNPLKADTKSPRKFSNFNSKYLAPLTDKLSPSVSDESAWATLFTNSAFFSTLAELQWSSIPSTVTDLVLPEWSKGIPEHIRRLKKELSMAPGSLADEIWRDSRDPYINPEIEYTASVRVSRDLCDQEIEFLARRRKFTRMSLANYLKIPVEEVHLDDVPTIAMIGSGGGLRALVAGAGSMMASEHDGLLDCVTYTAGVSGSCWLLSLYNSSIGKQSFEKVISHLRARIGTHIAHPPVALALLNTAPTNKYLISGFIEKLKGDPESNFGLVDLYGLLLGARLLVPKGELDVNEADLKVSNQRQYIELGQYPMPIYTAVRHHIQPSKKSSNNGSFSYRLLEKTEDKGQKESWFQWFEISPFEMFCEEFGAGIPTWALGRKFEKGENTLFSGNESHVPELRLPLLFGIFGSAFCASLFHYYKEVRPLFKSIIGFGNLETMIGDQNSHLKNFHLIDPAFIPNFIYKMNGKLPETIPEEICNMKHLKLMDAGMSNNLPLYPLLRPGRSVEIIIAFDASAEIKTDNWLSVADGYALQRGIKGWPMGAGWPKKDDSALEVADQINEVQDSTIVEGQAKFDNTRQDQDHSFTDFRSSKDNSIRCRLKEEEHDLGYCTIWVGGAEEHSSSPDRVKSKAVEADWELMVPNAGIAVIYFPFLSNPNVKDVDPVTSEYMSTWNFIYTPEEVDKVVDLARANFEEGKDKTRRCVRAVYERKKKERMEKEKLEKELRWRRKVRLGLVGKIGEGDHFYLT